MVLKIFKAVWFLSLSAVLLVLMYTYASLPEYVALAEGEGLGIGRNGLFYGILFVIAIVNASVFLMTKLTAFKDDFGTWFYGLIVTLNLFFVVSLSLTRLINSSERFDYSRIGPIIYGSVILIAVWAFTWPLYTVWKKIRGEVTVGDQ